MKRTNTVTFRQVIDDIIEEYKIAGKLKETRIITAWPEVLGPLAATTEKLYVKNKVLFARITSSVVRNELSMMRTPLIKALNEKAGDEVITDIVFR